MSHAAAKTFRRLSPSPGSSTTRPQRWVATIVLPDRAGRGVRLPGAGTPGRQGRAGPPGAGPAGSEPTAAWSAIVCGWKAGRSGRGGSKLLRGDRPRELLSPAMMQLTRWIADHYLCDWRKCWRPWCRPGVDNPGGHAGFAAAEPGSRLVARPGEETLGQAEMVQTWPTRARPLTAADWPRPSAAPRPPSRR